MMKGIIAASLVLHIAALGIEPATPVLEKLWAIGDLHGDAHCARQWVGRTGLIGNASAPPEQWVWMDPSAQLIFMGDYIDRGLESRDVLAFVHELLTRFPAHVHGLIGNHELNLIVDRGRPQGQRYFEYAYAAAHPYSYLAWVQADVEGGALQSDDEKDETASVLRALHDALLVVYLDRQQPFANGRVQMTPDGPTSIVRYVQPSTMRPRVASALRRWQAAYMRGVRPRAPLGAFLHRDLSVHLADTVFVHGGLPEALLDQQLPADAAAPPTSLDSLGGLAELNRRWHAAAAAAVETDVAAVDAAGAEKAARSLAESRWVSLATEMVEYRGAHEAYAMRYKDRHSRRASISPREVGCARVAAVLGRLNASRLAVGHTPESDVRIRCGGRLLALDSTLSRSFRAHGNYYCDPAMTDAEPRLCPPLRQQCEGQIVRLERAAAAPEGGGDGSDSAAARSWYLHVVDFDNERAEGGVDEEMKLEL